MSKFYRSTAMLFGLIMIVSASLYSCNGNEPSATGSDIASEVSENSASDSILSIISEDMQSDISSGGDSKSRNSGTFSSNSSNSSNNSKISISSSSADSNQTLYFVKNGVSNSTIIISKTAPEKVLNAAADLQSYISKMTGAIVKIGYDDYERPDGTYILVGQSKYTDKLGIVQPKGYPENEKVILKRIGSYLVLTGNDDMSFMGSQFAVNMFLEQQGCGWFGPDELLWQVVPNKKDITVDKLDIVHTPQFISRQTNVYNNYKSFSYRWYMGGVQSMIGHGLPQLISRENYFDSHPEWFSLINGVRDPFTPTWWQYCYSNQALANEVAKKVIQYFDNNPAAVQYSLAANDGWDEDWCECSVCASFPSDTDVMLTFANRVAKEVAKKYPKKRLSILSYHSMYFAPKSNVKAEPNVEVMFCRETNMTQPIDIGFNVGSGYFPETHNTYSVPWKQNFTDYISKAGLKNISIWEWYCLAVERPIWKDIPWVQGNVAIRNQKYWKSKGVSYVFYDHGPLPVYRETQTSFALRWPLWYVAAKGMWDSSKTGDQILQEACDKLFGEGSDIMFKYYHTLAEISESCTARSIAWVPPLPSEMYTPANKAKIDAIIKEAKTYLSRVSDKERSRMENQIEYWENARNLF